MVVISGGTIFFVNNNLDEPGKYRFIIIFNVVFMVGISFVLEMKYWITWSQDDPFM